ALADGRVVLRLLDKPETVLKEITAHEGGLCRMAAATGADYLITTGEDGRVMRVEADGASKELARFENEWVEHLAVHESGVVAVGFKKTAVLLDGEGKILARFEDHPSTIGGLCFDPRGKRLACSYYGGVRLWWVGGGADQKPHTLNWKGSHLDIRFAPSGKYLLTCMQENALHGWRLPDFADFAMSGYARKPRSFGWTEGGKWLASSGSPGIICWDCSGKGPMGRPAVILGEDVQDLTVQVACHPHMDMVAALTEAGGAYLARFQDSRIVNLKTSGQSEGVALAWSPSGRHLMAGTEDGSCYCWAFDE
ncbi:MAG TPA: WD40 repeat domain-containing protein, partial [Alphaproteobacteria bacterium]|nr:WD40 repeat domain-containing protein [Alphaproteobacteria bacterium]